MRPPAAGASEGDGLALYALVTPNGDTAARHRTWRLEGAAGPDAAGQVLGTVRSEMGGTARGVGAFRPPAVPVVSPAGAADGSTAPGPAVGSPLNALSISSLRGRRTPSQAATWPAVAIRSRSS